MRFEFPFVQARHYTRGPRPTPVRLVVLHSMENPEKPGRALSTAAWMAGENAPQASAHFFVDSGEIVQGVDTDDVAWAAPGANADGLHIEHAGYARQLAEDWTDVYSASMLDLSVRLCARLCRMYDIPATPCVGFDVRAGRRGITRHMDVTVAYGKSTHLDPGVGFPFEAYVRRVGELL